MQSDIFGIEFDTLHDIITTTRQADLISLSGATIGLLGDYLDPSFGRTQAALAFQLAPTSSNLVFGENPVGKKVTLKLTKRSGYYGLDSAATHEIKVWQVATGKSLDNLDSTEVKMNDLIDYKGKLLSHTTMTFNPNDTIPWDIELDSELAKLLVDNLVKNDTLYKNDTAFMTFFPGLIVETVCTCSQGNIVSIDYSADLCYMRLQFSNSTDSIRSLDFVLKNSNKRYSIFNHDYETSEVGQALDNADYKSMAFLQGMNGVGLKIEINGLDSLWNNDTSYSVNSAILRFQLAEESKKDLYLPPNSVFIKMFNKDGEEVFTPDYIGQTPNTTRAINYINDTIKDIYGYDIVLNRLLYEKIGNGINGENMAKREESMVITMYVNSQLTRANRAIIAGSEYADTTLRPKLYVVRSKIK